VKKLHNLSWNTVLILCLTIGLAPFAPPHVYEKLQMLASGELSRTIDWLDLLMHGSPWILAIVKAAASLNVSRQSP